MKKALEPRQQRFVEEYLIDLNATRAAIRAGYGRKGAKQQGQRLTTKPHIQAAISAGQAKLRAKNEDLAGRVIEEMKLIAFSDIRSYVDIDADTGAIRAKGFDEMPAGASRALEQIREDRMIREDAAGNDSIINSKITFKMHPKLTALDSLAKHLGLYERDNRQRTPAVIRVLYADDPYNEEAV